MHAGAEFRRRPPLFRSVAAGVVGEARQSLAVRCPQSPYGVVRSLGGSAPWPHVPWLCQLPASHSDSVLPAAASGSAPTNPRRPYGPTADASASIFLCALAAAPLPSS